MTSKELFVFLLLLLTLSQWVIFFKIRAWRQNRNPEPKQGKPVDRVLWHLISDHDTPWDAGTSWEKHGRGYIVALQRQGLDELLDERDVSDHRAAYTLGYCVREEHDRQEIAALRKGLARREDTIERQQQEIDELQIELAKLRSAAPETEQRYTPPAGPLEEAWNEWGRCPDDLDEIMKVKGWMRINAPEELEAVETAAATEPEPEEPTPNYKAMKGREKIETMLALKAEGKSNPEIAQLFGMTTGGVKGVISKNRPRPDNIVTIDFGVSERVSDGF